MGARGALVCMYNYQGLHSEQRMIWVAILELQVVTLSDHSWAPSGLPLVILLHAGSSTRPSFESLPKWKHFRSISKEEGGGTYNSSCGYRQSVLFYSMWLQDCFKCQNASFDPTCLPQLVFLWLWSLLIMRAIYQHFFPIIYSLYYVEKGILKSLPLQ